MGPRSHERGNLPHLPLDISPPGLASMGPRSHERGNIGSVIHAAPARASFNGAAFS